MSAPLKPSTAEGDIARLFVNAPPPWTAEDRGHGRVAILDANGIYVLLSDDPDDFSLSILAATDIVACVNAQSKQLGRMEATDMTTATNKAAHTPGPWIVSERARFTVVAPNAHGKAIVVARNTQEQHDHPLNDEADANLRLIAAAPEMKAALLTFASLYPGDLPATGILRQAIDEARALLARIDGTEAPKCDRCGAPLLNNGKRDPKIDTNCPDCEAP